ncbi:Major facilitator superfamily domain-containing protein 1 [Fasciola gigantica]|uniref:Lysosomal dipeptide transporter MFSD1 n=1 Tax=Fasciola gigantica TaxID=46835 RepID=A0A504YXQ8_FASGI|nr:Major facilitator superfamily domain-containing protein 1 [Fasciola gigantica]
MGSTDALYRPDLDDESETDIHPGCGSSLACDPSRWLHRYLMLFFICFLAFGSYFCYDNPAALQDVMVRDMDLTETEFMNLYAFYSWPNVALSFVGGFLIDRVFGIAWGAIIFSLCVLAGQVLFGAGALANSIGLMYFARFVFGIGGESLAVAQNTYTTEWFPPTELNFVFGLQLSMARVGSTVNMVTMHLLYQAVGTTFRISGYKRLGAALMIAAVTCVYSSICASILAYFTKRAKRISEKRRQRMAASQALVDGTANTTAESETPKLISFRDILHFPLAIWLICIICVTYYVAVFPFVSLGLIFFERKFYLPVTQAGVVNSLVYIVSAVASPAFGAAIDFTGRNLNWVLSGTLLTLFCHLCFAFTSGEIPPIVIMIILGLAYSILASSLWPLVAHLLPIHQRGTAYGLIQSIQNLGLGVISIFAGYLVDTKGYLLLEVFFTFCLSLSLAFTFVLYFWDQRHGDLLNASGAHRRSKPTVVVSDHSAEQEEEKVEAEPEKSTIL